MLTVGAVLWGVGAVLDVYGGAGVYVAVVSDAAAGVSDTSGGTICASDGG